MTENERPSERQNHPWEPLPDPLTLERKLTHRPFLIAFAVFVCSWIFVAVCAFNNGVVNINTDNNNETQQNDSSHNHICWKCAMNNSSGINNQISNRGIDPTPLLAAKYIILGFTLLSLLLSLSYIILSKLSAKLVHFMSLYCTFGLMLLVICKFAYNLFTGQGLSFITYVILTIISSFIFIVAITAYIIMRKKLIQGCQIVQVITEHLSHLPNSLIIPIIQSILSVIVVVFSTSVMIYLSAYPKDENNPNFETFIRIFHFINVFGCFWMIFFINGFGQILLTGNWTTWYWSRDEESVPKFTMLRYVGIIIRYHIGTIAYGSLAALTFSFIRILLSLMPCHNENCKPFLCLKFDFCRSTLERIEIFLYRFDSMNNYASCMIYGNELINHYLFGSLRANVILLTGQLSTIGISSLAALLSCHIINFESHVHYTAVVSIVVLASVITWIFSTLVRVSRINVYFSGYEFYRRLNISGCSFDPMLFMPIGNDVLLKLQDIKNEN